MWALLAEQIWEPQQPFGRVRWKVNHEAGQQGNVLRVTDPRSASAFRRLGQCADALRCGCVTAE